MELGEATRQFIRQHADDDVRQLALRFSSHRSTGRKDSRDSTGDAIDLPLALDQISGRQAARRKLPSWADIDGIVYPPHLSMEQCSSEQTALYKAQLLARLVDGWKAARGTRVPASLVDLTGGLGVDFSFMSRSVGRAVYVERNHVLCDIARHNFPLLGLEHAEVVCAEAETFSAAGLPSAQEYAPRVYYLDPARRNEHGARTYGMADCTPNVLLLRDELFKNADFIVLKLSPMLDWRAAVNDLGRQQIGEVHIVSVDNECKELLVVMRQDADETMLYGINLCGDGHDSTQESFSVSSVLAAVEPSEYAFPEVGQYLYEPNASLMKAGCFGAVSQRYAVKPIARDSHLFVSDVPVEGFPGRKFLISAISSMNKRDFRESHQNRTCANISTRNFPMKPDELRRRLKLRDGGDTYIFGTTLSDGRHVLLICEKS